LLSSYGLATLDEEHRIKYKSAIAAVLPYIPKNKENDKIFDYLFNCASSEAEYDYYTSMKAALPVIKQVLRETTFS
jgi:hypothetical protein